MKGWIIYDKKDAEKNIAFISRLTAELAKYDIEAKLVFLGSEPKKETPSFAINRSRDYKLAERLENKGVKVFNESALTKLSNDKRRMHKFFEGKVPQMNLVSEYPFVLKSVDGHGGGEVFMVNSREEEDKAILSLGTKDYIKQEVCSELGKDKRVYVVGGEVVASILREAEDFRSNYSLGGSATVTELNEKELAIVEKITRLINIDYAGIDLIYHNGEPVFNEIEDPVGARMLYENTDIDIVEIFVKYIVNNLLK